MDLKPPLKHAGARPAVRRATTRPGGQASKPRVSTMGSLVTLIVVASLAIIVTLAVFLSNANGRLQIQADQMAGGFEKLVTRSLAELDITEPLLGMGCVPSGLEVLTQQSLKSRVLDQIHLKDGRTGEICSPIKSSQPAVRAAFEASQTLTQAKSQTTKPAVLLAASDHGLLLARGSGSGDTLIGEVRMGDLSLHLGDAETDGYRAVISLLDGTILFDSMGLFRPGSVEASSAAFAGPSAQSLWHSVHANSTSDTYPVLVEVMPTPLILIKTGSRYLLTAMTLAVVFALILIAAFNHYLTKRISVERRLRIALTKRSFVPVIQPIVDAQTGRCKGGEVLMRWDHPARGLVSPEEFLPVAERLGLMGAMTMIVMERASHLLAQLAREHPQLYFSFNVDASQLRDPLFPERLGNIFNESSLHPRQVLLEIVEREAVDEQARVGLDRLREVGYRIAIDDFGTGQSSLGMLLSIGFDVLKIDRSFVSAIDGNQVNKPVLDAIIDMAQKLDVIAVAEGVETIEQHAFLVAKGVESIQGYLVSKPMPVQDFPAWLQQSKDGPGAYSVAPDVDLENRQKQAVQSARDAADVVELDQAEIQETEANLRHLRRSEELSATQTFRLQRTGDLLPMGQMAAPLFQAASVTFSSAKASSDEPHLMPV